MRRGRTYIAASLLGAAATLPVNAQDTGGTQAGLSLTPGLFWEDGDTRARVGFGANLASETRTQTLSFGLNGSIDSGYDTLEDAIRTPTARFTYGLENASTALNANVTYRRAEISALVFDDDLDSELLVVGTGQRADTSASTSLTFGRDAPFGGTLSLGFSRQAYLDTVDPSLLDQATQSAGLSLRFDIDRRLSATFSTNGSETDVDGDLGTDRINRAASLGLNMAFSETLNASLNVGGSRIKQTTALGDSISEGANASAAATRALSNGTVSGSVSTNVTTAGRLSKFEVDRAIELPRGELSFGGGFGQIDGDDAQALARVSWSTSGPRTEFGLSLDRALAVSGDGDGAVNSLVSLSVRQQLNDVSNVGAGLTLRDTNRLDSDLSDSRQANLSITYGRELTENWGLRSSYTQRWITETGADDREEQSFFLGLERDFQWRP